MSAVNVIADFLSRRTFPVLLAVWGLFAPAMQGIAAEGGNGQAEVRVVAILSADELGDRLRYPSFLAYDKDMDELYMTVGGAGKVIVYDSNFFPTVSLGPGRGADGARGIFINNDGWIYLCQGETENSPGRLTIFNPAFFPEQEILFDSIPGVEKFIPKDMVVGLTGNLYVVGQNNRGLLVLDQDGNFSHWLKPQDQIFDMEVVEAAQKEREESDPELTEFGRIIQDEVEAADIAEFLPRELIPGSVASRLEERRSGMGPVMVVDIERDSEGHLYILSEETGKVYVYSPFEELLFTFGQKGGSTGKMSRPRSLVVDEKKKAVYVVDYMRHTILIFDLGGKFMYEFGGLGTGPGWFQYPTGLTLTRDGLLAVADLFNHRVQILDVRFEYKFPLFQSPETMEPPILMRPEEAKPDIDAGEEDILEPAPL
ncbi:MAG: NHL repeat-containing protein [Desulfobulbaceae bacterium]|nr:NHL repeat-containing protein [Desulfobulbaceae bacterium]